LINASGKIVTHGLVDMHVHLHEPDYEHQETIQNGCRAAACGGFTAVCAMPNTNPVNDNPAATQAVLERAAQAQLAWGYPVAAITRRSEGCRLCDFEPLKHAGAVAVATDQLVRAKEIVKCFDNNSKIPSLFPDQFPKLSIWRPETRFSGASAIRWNFSHQKSSRIRTQPLRD
jgi:dihydroorotase-like cyclic amidohydrolase